MRGGGRGGGKGGGGDNEHGIKADDIDALAVRLCDESMQYLCASNIP